MPRRSTAPVLLLSALIAVTAGNLLTLRAGATGGQRPPAVAAAERRIGEPTQLPVPAATSALPRTPAAAPAPAPAPPPAPPSRRKPAAVPPKVSPPAVRLPPPTPQPHLAPPPPSGPTSWPDLNGAIARLPGTGDGITWVISDRYGHWATTELYSSTVYVSRSVPVSRLTDVVRHEYSHVASMRAYGGDVETAISALRSYFGDQGEEVGADCMARVLGATWTNYSPCADDAWRSAARRLLAGQRL